MGIEGYLVIPKDKDANNYEINFANNKDHDLDISILTEEVPPLTSHHLQSPRSTTSGSNLGSPLRYNPKNYNIDYNNNNYHNTRSTSNNNTLQRTGSKRMTRGIPNPLNFLRKHVTKRRSKPSRPPRGGGGGGGGGGTGHGASEDQVLIPKFIETSLLTGNAGGGGRTDDDGGGGGGDYPDMFFEDGPSDQSGKNYNSITPPATTLTTSPQKGRESTGRKRWNSLKDRVEKGDFLLQTVGAVDDVGEDDDNGPSSSSPSSPRDKHQVQEYIDTIRRGMEFSLWHCVVAIVLYLGVSILFYNFVFQPEWTILDSCYFAVTTFTTVGYGDLMPGTEASMIFTCMYALAGVGCLGIALGIIGSNLMDAQERVKAKADELLAFEVMSIFEAPEPSSASLKESIGLALANGSGDHDDGRGVPPLPPPPLTMTTSSDDKKHVQFVPDEENQIVEVADISSEMKSNALQQQKQRNKCSTWLGPLPLLGLLLILAYFIGQESEWDLNETLYYMIITSCTVGYGDLAPTTDHGKLLAIFFIPLAVGSMGHWLGSVANYIMDARSSRFRYALSQQSLTQHDLDIMDENGDGTVTRAEFLEFMLIAMNKIDDTLVKELRQHFDKLDVDKTGELNRQDLIEAARQKIKSPKHKMRLSAYKKKLLRQGQSGKNHNGGTSRRGSSIWGNLMGGSSFFRAFSFRN